MRTERIGVIVLLCALGACREPDRPTRSARLDPIDTQRVAIASETVVSWRFIPPSSPGREDGLAYPTVRVEVAGAARPPGAFSLQVAAGEGEPASPPVAAAAALAYPDSSEEMTLVVLVQGNQRFMDYRDGKAGLASGAYAGVTAALDAFAGAGSKAARATVLAYGEDVRVLVPLGAARALAGAELGRLDDFRAQGQFHLKAGLDEAATALAPLTGRKILVVIGHGGDALNADLRPARERLLHMGVELACIRVNPSRQDDGLYDASFRERMQALCPDLTEATSEELPARAAELVTRINARTLVDFPGERFADEFDGRRHTMVLAAAGQAPAVFTPEISWPAVIVTFADPPRGGRRLRVAGYASFALIVVVAVLAIRRGARRDRDQKL
jgi:hypothetical protein